MHRRGKSALEDGGVVISDTGMRDFAGGGFIITKWSVLDGRLFSRVVVNTVNEMGCS